MTKVTALGLAVGAALLCATPLSVQISSTKPVAISVDKAEARLGRPLTPMSIAGVNRRWHRRAYYGAAIGAAAVGGAYYYNRAHCGYYRYPPCY